MRALVLDRFLPSLFRFKAIKLNRYLLSTILVAVTVVVTRAFSDAVVMEARFLLLYPTMFVISFLFGFGPAIYSLVLSSVFVWFFMMKPLYSFKFISHMDWIKLTVYLCSCFFVSWVTRKGYLSERALKRSNEILRDLLHSQREVMKDMKATEERLRLATSVSKVGIWEWNLQNSEYTTTLQHDLSFGLKEKALSWSYASFKRHLHPFDRELVIKAIDDAISSGTDFEIDFRIIWPDGTVHWMRKFGKVEVSADNGPARVIGTCHDITEQKASEDAMKEALFYRDEFLSIASHELKTPLTSLKLQSQVYKRSLKKPDAEEPTPEKVGRLMDVVDLQVNRLVRLVDDMLDISRIRTGNLSIIKDLVDLKALTEDCVERMRPQFGAPHLISVVSAQETIIHGDHMRIEQVITNLLNNALRYGQGSPVSVALARTDREAIVSISDQGRGISKEDQLKIFNRFQRAVPAREVSGLGLGLYIAREIIRAHGGTITVESELGKGATFSVRLPLGVIL